MPVYHGDCKEGEEVIARGFQSVGDGDNDTADRLLLHTPPGSDVVATLKRKGREVSFAE